MRLRWLVLVAALALAVAGCAGDDEEATPTTRAQPASDVPCAKAKRPPKRRDGGQPVPLGTLNPFRSYRVLVQTNCGNFTIRLNIQNPSRTVLSFVRLVRAGFFDRTVFHRIVPGFVIQGGDPTQSGLGGPGYRTVDPPPDQLRYTKGIVAMAKAPEEPRGAAGSQFFIVTADDADLPPEYAVIGRVTRGLDVVARIGKRATKHDEHGDPIPTPNPVVIRKMRLLVS